MKPNNLEDHPFLPSGDWEGFYCYGSSPKQHKMFIQLSFKGNSISGFGSDDVAPFNWKGAYCLNRLKVELIKRYATHQFSYNGDIDENGIWGTWCIPMPASILSEFKPEVIQSVKEKTSGGFHIWPKKKNQESKKGEIEENITESKKLKSFFNKKTKL